MTSLFDIINPEIYFHRLRILFSLLFISIFFSVVSGQIYISDNVKFSISDSTVFYISGELVTTDESIEVVENKIVKVPHRKEFETSIKSEINNEPNVKDENLKKKQICTSQTNVKNHYFFESLFIRPPPSMEDISSFNTNI